MPQSLQGPLSLLGRIMLSAIFLMAAVGQKIPQFSSVVGLMEKEGVPLAPLMLVGAIAFLIAGSLSVILGYQARIGATLLLIFLVLAAYYFHDFWTFTDPKEVQNQTAHFMKNLALCGAMLTIIANGSGAWSLDRRLDKRQTAPIS